MKLEQLMEGVPFTLVQGSLDTEIADIIYDSRKAAPGLLFVCIVGTQRDSHAFAADCAAKGISALVIQHDIDLSTLPGVTVVKVESSRYAMALMSANLFGNPARQMTMIGVTGTKGKTTTTHMIKSVLEAAGRSSGSRCVPSGRPPAPSARQNLHARPLTWPLPAQPVQNSKTNRKPARPQAGRL